MERHQLDASRASPRTRPAVGEASMLWDACRPVTDDDEVAAWLAGRGLDAADIAGRDLARALPSDMRSLPRWASCRRIPWTAGWRLVLPVYDAAGAMTVLRGRLVREPRHRSEPKSSAAALGAGSAAGLVLADGLAKQLLAGARADACSPRAPLRLMIAEGEADFLALGCAWSDADEEAPAVVGIVAGSWTAAVAARIPAGTVVTIATDQDATGDRYAQHIARTLDGRCSLRRWRPPEVP